MEVNVLDYLSGLKPYIISGYNSDWFSLKVNFWTLYSLISNYVEDRLIFIISGVLGYFVTCLFAYYVIVFYLKLNVQLFHHIKNSERVLVVTAHPDDECMFFGPVILELVKKSCNVYLLCLSPGNFDGKGALRKVELWKSCHILGIPESNIVLCKNSQLPDDPKIKWKKSVLSSIILSHIEIYECDTVITFDQLGVSGHLNHRAIFFSVCDLIDSKTLPAYCRVYFLETVNILRKYSSFADFFLSFIFSSFCYLLTFKEFQLVQQAMKEHKSQYVWFRKLYMKFSRQHRLQVNLVPGPHFKCKEALKCVFKFINTCVLLPI